MSEESVDDFVALLDWRRRIAELYGEVRSMSDRRAAWERWRDVRARLFREHPQSPLPVAEREDYSGPYLYDYDPAWRALASLEPAEPLRLELPTSGSGSMSFTRFGLAHFTAGGVELSLDLYWLDGYGGGLLAPFADATSGGETYGAGRYVLDTVKGADLGQQDGRLVLDFNFSYPPSCSYDPRWICPLAPPANRLAVPVRAGERTASG
jgi:uncharacterized protein (DUF1684 family)